MDLEKQFEEAILRAREIPNASEEDQLQLLSLYNQATIGDLEIKPSEDFYQNLKPKESQTWSQLKGMIKTEAMEKYIKFVDDLLKRGQ